MTIKEYQKVLKHLSEIEFSKFRKDFGGSMKLRNDYVRDFVDHPEHERRICQLLRLNTEAEKLTKSSFNSALASLLSAIFAFIALGVTILTIAISNI